MSAKDGAQTTKLSVDDSSEAWYSRDDVKRLYVKSDDRVHIVGSVEDVRAIVEGIHQGTQHGPAGGI